jgi:hypothetical protein
LNFQRSFRCVADDPVWQHVEVGVEEEVARGRVAGDKGASQEEDVKLLGIAR